MSDEDSIQFLGEMPPVWITHDSSEEPDQSFLIDDLTRAVYGVKTPDKQEQHLIQKIAGICSEQECKLRLRVIYLGIVYFGVRIAKTGEECVVHLFQIRHSSEDSELCCIIDQSGIEYEDMNDFLKRSTGPDWWLMVPRKLQYEWENGEPPGPTGGKILESIISLRGDEDDCITLMKNNLNHFHHAKFDASRIAYSEVVQPGLILKSFGDRKFLRDMESCEDLNRFYANFTMTEDGMFLINGKMPIHPRGFFQLPGRVRKVIIDGMRRIKDSSADEVDEAIEFYKNELAESDPDGLYRQNVLDIESTRNEWELLDPTKFDVKSLKEINISGNHIFAHLKSFEIRRLYKVLKNHTHESIELVIKFATEIHAQDFVDFCAAAEFSHKAVMKEFKKRRQEYRADTGMSRQKWEKSLKDIIISEFQTRKLPELTKSFKDLMARCEGALNLEGPKFHSLIAAANHVDRHAKDFSKGSAKDSPEAAAIYLNLAQQMVMSNFSEVQWTQDGSKLCCTYLCKEHSAEAIKYVSYPDKIGIIATLMWKKKLRNVTGNCFYDHPDY